MFWFERKKFDFLRDYFFLLSAAKYKAKYGEGLKILTPMIQGLPIALAVVKAVLLCTSENVLNEIRKIIYYLYWAKETTKNVYNNIMPPLKFWNRMSTMFICSWNSKTSDPHRLLINVSDKINLKRMDKYALSNLSIYCTWKIIKNSCNR